jgi:hypothetical protein
LQPGDGSNEHGEAEKGIWMIDRKTITTQLSAARAANQYAKLDNTLRNKNNRPRIVNRPAPVSLMLSSSHKL